MLTRVVSQIDDCNSATEMCKSVDLLQAIRWIAQAELKEPKVKSLKEAMILLEDVTEYRTADGLSKVLSEIHSTWLSRKMKASNQRKIKDIFK